jgi:hypothetical protein
MLLAGRRTHHNTALYCMVWRGLLWVQLWEVKIIWVRIMGVTLVTTGLFYDQISGMNTIHAMSAISPQLQVIEVCHVC